METPKRPQDKRLSIPNYYKRNGNENKQKKSNPIWQNGNPGCLQTVNGGDNRETMQVPYVFCRNGHWSQTLGRGAFTGQKGNSKRANLGLSHLYLGYIMKHYHSKWHMYPNVHGSAASASPDTEPKKYPSTYWILKKYGTYIQWAIPQTWKTTTEMMKLWHWAPGEGTLKDCTWNEVNKDE